MADFKTHITVSSALGVAYGVVAWKHFNMPAPTCVLAGTLCGVSGMLPDLDSDSGVPLRESLAFAAACVPMLLIERVRHLGWSPETMVLVGAGVYIAIRFGVGKLLKRFTVHRGMFHSLPAAVIAGEIAFLLASGETLAIRGYKACAVVAGFLSHLLLDELYSVKVHRGSLGLKSSFGTAFKLWGSGSWSNLVCYAQLIALGLLVLRDPIWTDVSPEAERLHKIASTVVDEVERRTNVPLPSGTIPWLAAPQTPMPTPQPTATGYAPPANYQPQPQYVAPPTYGPAQPYYGPSQPYVAPPQPYVQPYVQPQQAQSPTYAPYVSPRY